MDKQKYEKKRRSLRVSFNLENEQDVALMQLAASKNFSQWVKAKLKEELGNEYVSKS